MPLKALLFDLDNTLVPEMANYELAFSAACGEVARRHSFDLTEFRAAVFRSAEDLWRASETFDFCAMLGIGSPTSLLSEFPGERTEFALLRKWAPRYARTRGHTVRPTATRSRCFRRSYAPSPSLCSPTDQTTCSARSFGPRDL